MILCLVGVREGLPEKQMRKLKLYLEILTLNLRNECVCVCVCVCVRACALVETEWLRTSAPEGRKERQGRFDEVISVGQESDREASQRTL